MRLFHSLEKSTSPTGAAPVPSPSTARMAWDARAPMSSWTWYWHPYPGIPRKSTSKPRWNTSETKGNNYTYCALLQAAQGMCEILSLTLTYHKHWFFSKDFFSQSLKWALLVKTQSNEECGGLVAYYQFPQTVWFSSFSQWNLRHGNLYN